MKSEAFQELIFKIINGSPTEDLPILRNFLEVINEPEKISALFRENFNGKEKNALLSKLIEIKTGHANNDEYKEKAVPKEKNEIIAIAIKHIIEVEHVLSDPNSIGEQVEIPQDTNDSDLEFRKLIFKIAQEFPVERLQNLREFFNGFASGHKEKVAEFVSWCIDNIKGKDSLVGSIIKIVAMFPDGVIDEKDIGAMLDAAAYLEHGRENAREKDMDSFDTAPVFDGNHIPKRDFSFFGGVKDVVYPSFPSHFGTSNELLAKECVRHDSKMQQGASHDNLNKFGFPNEELSYSIGDEDCFKLQHAQKQPTSFLEQFRVKEQQQPKIPVKKENEVNSGLFVVNLDQLFGCYYKACTEKEEKRLVSQGCAIVGHYNYNSSSGQYIPLLKEEISGNGDGSSLHILLSEIFSPGNVRYAKIVPNTYASTIELLNKFSEKGINVCCELLNPENNKLLNSLKAWCEKEKIEFPHFISRKLTVQGQSGRNSTNNLLLCYKHNPDSVPFTLNCAQFNGKGNRALTTVLEHAGVCFSTANDKKL